MRFEIPAIEPHIKLLQGNDGVERWKDKKLWDFVLENVRIVVSTPQILYEALTHGFVLLARLSLLIFDEGICPFSCVELAPSPTGLLGHSPSSGLFLEETVHSDWNIYL